MHQVEIATTQQTLLDTPEMVLNMGPQHPSTHGVLRVVLKLDGETVIDLDCDIGYLHRGMEKIAENRMYTMIAPYWDRLDYIAAVSNGLVWVETVEQMMKLEVPPRAHYLRTILTELNDGRRRGLVGRFSCIKAPAANTTAGVSVFSELLTIHDSRFTIYEL